MKCSEGFNNIASLIWALALNFWMMISNEVSGGLTKKWKIALQALPHLRVLGFMLKWGRSLEVNKSLKVYWTCMYLYKNWWLERNTDSAQRWNAIYEFFVFQIYLRVWEVKSSLWCLGYRLLCEIRKNKIQNTNCFLLFFCSSVY